MRWKRRYSPCLVRHVVNSLHVLLLPRPARNRPQIAQSELTSERAAKEDAVARASKAEREVDQAKARAAVLDNKVAVSGSVVICWGNIWTNSLKRLL